MHLLDVRDFLCACVTDSTSVEYIKLIESKNAGVDVFLEYIVLGVLAFLCLGLLLGRGFRVLFSFLLCGSLDVSFCWFYVGFESEFFCDS